MRRLFAVLPFVLLTATAFAHASAPAPAAPAARVVTVEMRDDLFDPEILQIDVGDSVTWVNHGRNPHNVVASDGAFSSKILQPGESFTMSFARLGSFSYYCSLHGAVGTGMHGRIYVGVTPEYASTTSAT